MSQKPSIPKGSRDFLPEVMLRREYIFNTIKTVFRKYGYAPIETPAMEKLSVLTGKYGEEGDRLIFKILNSGDFLKKARSMDDARKLSFEIAEKALRYDLTVPFARFVVMHEHDLSFPFKRYQIQPVWRADRPQKGRYREFYQCDADVVGSESLIFEAEYLCMIDEALSNLGLKDFNVLISNRKVLSGYAEVIGQEDKFTDICIAIDKLDKIGKEGVTEELERRDISNASAEQLFDLIEAEGSNAEKLKFLEGQFSSSDIGRKGIRELQTVFEYYEHFERFNGRVIFDPKLARGLDYYTGAIFEVRSNEVEMGSLLGGGRYDNLTGVFGKAGLSGVGISFGADRIYDVMAQLGLFEEMEASATQVMLTNFGEQTLGACLKIANELRKAGIRTEIYPDAAKMKKQFTYADKKKIPYTLVVGEDELAKGEYQLKNMDTGEQQSLGLEGVIKYLNS